MGLAPRKPILLLIALAVAGTAACAGTSARPVVTAVAAPQPSGAAGGESGQTPVFRKVPPEENTALVPAEPAGGQLTAEPYRFAVDDHLDISVYGEEELQHVEVPVRPDGMISFTFVGDVMAAGRTVEEVRAELTEKLARFLRSPQVTVIAKEFGQKKVFLGGEVKTPGVLYLGGREGTLLDALYKGGLVTDKADLEASYIMRGNKIVAADFVELVRGNTSRNVQLADRDVIYVPENVNRYVYVVGEVRSANAFEIGDPVPIVQVIAKAGGIPNTGKRREIAVIRGGLKTPEIAIVDGKLLLEGDLSQNIWIRPGDIVYVAKNALGHYNDFIDVILRTISPVVQATIVSNTVNP